MPTGAERTERLDDVMAVIYLVFNEGYAATAGTSWMRTDLCLEAIRLARMLAARLPVTPRCTGCRRCSSLQASRCTRVRRPRARPSCWRSRTVRALGPPADPPGLAALARAEGTGQPVGAYTVQAAIAACRARARRRGGHRLGPHRRAVRPAPLRDNPVVEINRAVAHGRAFGPAAGLAVLDAVADDAGAAYGHCGTPSAATCSPGPAGYGGVRRVPPPPPLTRNDAERSLLLRRAEFG